MKESCLIFEIIWFLCGKQESDLWAIVRKWHSCEMSGLVMRAFIFIQKEANHKLNKIITCGL